MKHKRLWIAVITALAAAAAGVGLWLYGAFLPGWITWNSAEISCDLGNDGTEETIRLKNRRIHVRRGEESLYSTPLLWRVSDVFTEDLDRDGNKEFILIVWKHGSYGRHRPFWVERDTLAFSQHIFVFTMNEGAVRSVWMSSDIGSNAEKAGFDEEGHLHLWYTDGYERIWAWEEWGFKLFGEKSGETLSLIAVGDNIAHASVLHQAYDPESGTFVFDGMYEEVREKISEYDLAAVNQETILVHDPALQSGFPDFATPESMGSALVNAGFDIVLAATNHTNDIGERGLSDTLSFWENYPEVLLLGLHETREDYEKVDYVEKNGYKLALFNCTESLNGRDLPEKESWKINTLAEKKKLLKQIAKAENHSDLTICFLHFGEEYSSEPTKEQRDLAAELADAGADVLIGTHPHILQSYERITTENGASALVFWSLGNFMSHQMKPETLLGGAASLLLERDYDGSVGVTGVELLPTVCHFNGKSTKVYFLSDYTEELAAEHSLNREKTCFTLKSLEEQFDTVVNNSYHE